MIYNVALELKKMNHQDKIDALKLTETRVIVDAWRNRIGKINPQLALAFELACWQTLVIEWGEDSQIFFDYKNKNVKCVSKTNTAFI